MPAELNLAISKKAVDAFIASMNAGVTPEAQATAARDLIDELKKASALAEKGINRKTLTVCSVQLGYVCPKDADRFLRKEIPRLTVYRTENRTRNMSVHSKRPPKVYKERQKCTTEKKSIVNTTTGTHKRPVKQKESSTQ